MTVAISRLYDDYSTAQQVVRALEAAGLPAKDISIISNNSTTYRGDSKTARHDSDRDGRDDRAEGAEAGASMGAVVGGTAGVLAGLGVIAIPGLGPVVAAGWLAALATGAVAGGAAGGIIGALTQAGVSKEEAHVYAEGVRRGGTFVTARVPDRERSRYEAILARSAVDILEREKIYRKGGWTKFDERIATDGDAVSEKIPVIEEQLAVGKRTVEKGGVRVSTHITEKPVEETVSLREERVVIERHPVDRVATAADLQRAKAKDGVIEVRNVVEEPVISKTARVVEEVEIGRSTTEHSEPVRDTVRRTDVEVEKVDVPGKVKPRPDAGRPPQTR